MLQKINATNRVEELVHMNEQEIQWFEALTKDRLDSADTLDKPSMRGVQRSVVDKYSDQAHFIYELLQNADDVKATSAHFRLLKDGLYFIHNGSVGFTVSDPTREDLDSKIGALGHINAITSIANSSKTEASIGKFGVGFKAVFQYTQTPHIYDPKSWFKIERFIVPHLLDADIHWRQPSDTVFYFPFDHKQKTPLDSHEEIFEKLKALEFPVLFLSNLNSVSFDTDEVSGKYTKKVTQEFEHGDIKVQRVVLELDSTGFGTFQHLWVFTRYGVTGSPYSVSYTLGKSGTLEPIERPAFCFFPTKETTHLKFIIHAPFLLTDSRESIKAGERHNEELILELAQLAADSLPVLRDQKLVDDGILEIIPYDESKFSELDDRNKISFQPFYSIIKSKLQSDNLLPALNGTCSPKSSSYWASDTELVELFSDKQLAELTGTSDANWVFRTRGKKDVQNVNKVLASYIDGSGARNWNRKDHNLIVASLDPESMLKKITPDFIAKQPIEWLHKLYLYLTERKSYQGFVKDKAIFLDQNGHPVPAFDGNKQPILFLSDNDIEGYTTINSELLSSNAARELIEIFGIKKPSLKDEIYNKILPLYDNQKAINTSPHFTQFFRYFKECEHGEVGDFIKLISDKSFLKCKSADNETIYRGQASDLYLPSSDLPGWFEPKRDTKFLLLDEYREMVDKVDHGKLDTFFKALKILTSPKILQTVLEDGKRKAMGLSHKGNHSNIFIDKIIDGLDEILANIDYTRSITIWNVLVKDGYLGREMLGKHEFHLPHERSNRIEYFDSSAIRKLQSEKWILNRSGELVAAKDITIQTLSEQYCVTSIGAENLILLLKIRDETQDNSHLSAEEARKVKLADEIERLGLSEDEILIAITEAKLKKDASQQSPNGAQLQPSGSQLIEDIISRRPSTKGTNTRAQDGHSSTVSDERGDEVDDSDDYMPKLVNYSKKIERAKDRCAKELDLLEREQALQDKAERLPRYSYGWFLALLELECMASKEKNADGKTISISFGRVKRDNLSSKTIILQQPNSFIPQSIEELSGIRVDLHYRNGSSRKLHVESFTAREFSLHGKLESADELEGLDLSQVLEAHIDVQNPSFLLVELLKRFYELRLDEEFDMKAGLTSNIEFVFGPPGTGKTTHLAEKVLIPLMNGADYEKVLVLTPTNKAADVLTTRIMESMGEDNSYLDWLVRFGTSADERIESAGVLRDRSFNIEKLSRSVTVTTIARFAYDGFTGDDGKKLNAIEWDAIIIDEASMISLANIIYPLYWIKPRRFIIAGDPFQIEPIVAVDQWKDQNIYTLVGLNKAGSFANPVTEPYDYKITTLETQYRSIPTIGEVFSSFTYDGILKHHREEKSQRQLIFSGLDAKPINLIKFPVSKFESIYRTKRLDSGTPYQTYSALFTFEFVRWMAQQIELNRSEKIRIGVIAPYRAQANLLSRLNDSWAKKPDNVNIQVGTIHGFQGDECNIIIAVLNPPPTISRSSRMFLNKQNILNVAISRARDYLFIVMPDSDTECIGNLHKIKEMEKLVKAGDAYAEFSSHKIEDIIWGNANYLEENIFSTGHQMVNVYRKPERYYEVRSDDSAIDVQIHEKHSETEK